MKTRKQEGPLEPATPLVNLVEYDTALGVGLIEVDKLRYVLIRLRDGTRTVGMRLTRYCDKRGLRKIDIDFTGEHGWTCDCEDATYRPNREGGCKHVVALKFACKRIRGEN